MKEVFEQKKLEPVNAEMKKKFFEIAAAYSYEVEERGDLEWRMNDSDDFLDISVGALLSMLQRAYFQGGLETTRVEYVERRA